MLQPFHRFLVIEQEEKEQVTNGGIVLSSSKKPTAIAKVLAVSENVTEVQVGDRVLVNQYAPLEIAVDDSSVTVVDMADVYGKV